MINSLEKPFSRMENRQMINGLQGKHCFDDRFPPLRREKPSFPAQHPTPDFINERLDMYPQ
jgi:hypothetical protein